MSAYPRVRTNYPLGPPTNTAPTSSLGKAGVEGKQELEALVGPDLFDDDAARPHPEALADQVTQLDLIGALEACLSGPHGHPIGQERLSTKPVLLQTERRHQKAGLTGRVRPHCRCVRTSRKPNRFQNARAATAGTVRRSRMRMLQRHDHGARPTGSGVRPTAARRHGPVRSPTDSPGWSGSATGSAARRGATPRCCASTTSRPIRTAPRARPTGKA